MLLRRNRRPLKFLDASRSNFFGDRSNPRSVSLTSANCQVKPQRQAPPNVFDRRAKVLQRERAALSERADYHEFLKEEIGYRLADRIYDIKRTFPKVLDLGCGRGHVSKHISSDCVEELTMCDSSEILMSRASCGDGAVKTNKVVCDEENLLSAFQPDTFNMVISNLTLHWVNELPSCFAQVKSILKNDGVFLGSLFGCDTLFELRSSLQLAELERRGGISPHVSPFARPRDIGGLLGQAGFAMLTLDSDEEVFKYPTMFELLRELKGMGENNAAWNRCLHLPRDTLLAASAIYQELYGSGAKKEKEKAEKGVEKTEEGEEDDSEGVTATFQIIYFIGWKPDPSQPQPLPRGGAEKSFRDLYKLENVVMEGATKIKLDDEEK